MHFQQCPRPIQWLVFFWNNEAILDRYSSNTTDKWWNNMSPAIGHFCPFMSPSDTDGHSKWFKAAYDFLFMFNSNHDSISLGFNILMTQIFQSRGRFGHFWWPCGQDNWWIQFPARGFLLVFHSNHSSKMHHFWAIGMWQTHRRTDRHQLRSMPPLWWWQHNNSVEIEPGSSG